MVGRGKGARRSGHAYELKVRNAFRDIGFIQCITSREGNRLKDAQGIDLLNTGPFDVQVKNYKTFRSPLGDFDKMPDDEKRIKTCVMNLKNQGTFAVLPADRFYAILKSLDYKTLRKLLNDKV